MRHARGWRWLSAGLVLAVALPASAQDTPLALAPAKSAVVIHVKGFERTKDRLAKLVQNAVPEVALKEILDGAIQMGFGDRQLKGLPPDGSILAAMELPPDPNTPPKEAAIILRVTDYATFRDGVLTADERKAMKKGKDYDVTTLSTSNEEIYFINLKAYAVVTMSKDTAEGYASGKLQKGVEGKLGKEGVEAFNKNDVAVFVDMIAVNKVYGDQIAGFRTMIEGQFDENQKKGMEMLFQALQDARGILLAADFRPEGLALHAEAVIAKESKLNEALKDGKPVAMNEMGVLPPGLMVYFQSVPNFSDAFSPGFGGVSSETPGMEAIKKLASELAKTAREAGATSMIGGFSFDGSIQVMPAASPAKVTEAQQKFFESLKGTKADLPGLKGPPQLKLNERTYRGVQLHQVAVEIDFAVMEKALAQQGNPAAKPMLEIMKRLIGDKQTSWFGHSDKANITVTAKDWEKAKTILDAYLDGKGTVGQEKAFTDTRKNLPEQVSGVALMSAPALARFIGQMIPELMKELGMNLPAPNIPPATEASYIGFSVTAVPQRGGIDLYISVAAVKEFRRVLEPIFQGLGGIGGQ